MSRRYRLEVLSAIESSLGCSPKAIGLEQPRQIRGCRYIVRQTEGWPPRRYARIEYDSAMCEIDDAMGRQRKHDNPKR